MDQAWKFIQWLTINDKGVGIDDPVTIPEQSTVLESRWHMNTVKGILQPKRSTMNIGLSEIMQSQMYGKIIHILTQPFMITGSIPCFNKGRLRSISSIGNLLAGMKRIDSESWFVCLFIQRDRRERTLWHYSPSESWLQEDDRLSETSFRIVVIK